MVTLYINGLQVSVEQGTTILEAANFLGFPIPTLCHMEGLSPLGACRLCVVEVKSGKRTRVVASCMYPVAEGIEVSTKTDRVMNVRIFFLVWETD
jgi:NADH dehydrogenase/NADH:ubiquinone oxidoreductase subunit G